MVTILCMCNYALAQQGLSNNWLSGYLSWGGKPFGQNRINFFTGSPTVAFDSIDMNFAHTHANISDSAGNMLFYTNGYYIADATDDTMDNGGGINPGAYANFVPDGFLIPQGALIIRKPLSNIYYLFHSSVDNYPNPNSSIAYHLRITTIDMDLNNGLGKVITKNVAIISDTLNVGKITACKHGNGRDWWVVAHRMNSNKFYKILVTPYGADSISEQSIGSFRATDAGQAKFSSDGTRYAYFHYNTAGLDVYDFDRCTGMLSNWRNDTIPIQYGNVGVEFSPNSQQLYVGNITEIYQYNANDANLLTNRNVVAIYDGFYDSVPGLGTYLCYPQLAPDGKIYITTGNGTRYFHILDQPDSPGLACNVIQHGLMVPSFYFNTIPNHPNYFLGANGLCNNLSYESLESWKVKKVTAFGNPTHDKFTLWFPVDKDVGVLEIYDVNGACIRREYVAQWSQYKTVDISEFSDGIYLVKMSWPDGEGSVKVVSTTDGN